VLVANVAPEIVADVAERVSAWAGRAAAIIATTTAAKNEARFISGRTIYT
jgi:hypothetical protein